MQATAPDGTKVFRAYLRASFDSREDAQRLAEHDASLAKRNIERGEQFNQWYKYADRTRPEPLLEEIFLDSNGSQRVAALTINAYGAYILQALHLLMLIFPRRNNQSWAFSLASGKISLVKSPAPSGKLLLLCVSIANKNHNLALGYTEQPQAFDTY